MIRGGHVLTFGNFLAIAVPVLVVIALIVRAMGKKHAAEDRTFSFLKATNAEHGTRFPTAKGEKYQLQMGSIGSTCMLFDQDKKLVVVSDEEGNCEIKPLGYIRNWELSWLEKNPGSPTAIKMNVGTTDLNRPNITIWLGQDIKGGRDWNQKLDLLLNTRSA
jgi:hypothetical protein